MKNGFLFAILAMSVSVAQPRVFGEQAAAKSAPMAAKELKAAEVDALLATPGRALVVDLRIPSDIELQGAFPVYLSIPPVPQSSAVEKYLAAIPKGMEIIALSTRAADGAGAAAVLTRNGFKVAGLMGAASYEQQGGKLMKFKRYTHWAMTGNKPPNPRAAAEAPKSFKELNKAEIDAVVAAPDKVLVIDVRSPGEIAYWGGFPVILNIQTEEGDTGSAGIQKHIAEIPKDKPIVTVSGRANRSGFAAALLAKNGFNVTGAIGAMTYGEEGGKLWKDPAFKPPVQ